MSVLEKISTYTNLVKIQHSIFAFPFLIGGIFLAPGWRNVNWLTGIAVAIAMVAARNAAMAFNRLVDQLWDEKNPRTSKRELPQGKLKRFNVVVFVSVNAAIFIASAAMINQMALLFSPLVIILLLSYSYTKRFTWLCHFFLGMVIGLAPVGGWIAVSGQLAWAPFTLMGALMFYIAGFDILYATQDAEFDRIHNLHSIPAQFGIHAALWFARVSHLISLFFFIVVGSSFNLGLIYWIGVFIIALLMIYENSLVHPDDLSKVNIAFFHVNSIISVLVGLAILGGLFVSF